MSGMPDPSSVINALPDPLLVADSEGRILSANPAAEEFFQTGQSVLQRQTLVDVAPFGSPLLLLHKQASEGMGAFAEYDVQLGTPRSGVKLVNIRLAPIVESPGNVVIQIEERSMASKMDRSLTHRGAARAVTGMASVLAHEVKNPLSGIRGAAQLLEQGADEEDQELTRLITDEVQRIVGLVDRMEAFSNPRPAELEGVNIHMVLERVRRIAEAGFARNIRIVEAYDPSLPMVLGNQDQLIQVFLNLVKNAAEAAPESKGEIRITTAYRHGVRLATKGAAERVQLPLEVTISDNGPGIPDDMRLHMFDPFVTTKPNGTGLGLALVAKIIDDFGGIVEFDDVERGTVCRVHLPVLRNYEES